MTLIDDGETLYDDRKFKGVELSQAELRDKVFENCTFTGCNFTETQFKSCKFVACVFRQCDLSLITVKGCTFTRVHFEHCKSYGVNWADVNWMPGFSSLSFANCGLNYSTFMSMDLRKLEMIACVAKAVNFEDADLTNAILKKTDFAESRFSNTNLSGADFSEASNYTIDVTANRVRGAKFSLPEAMSLLSSLDIILNDLDGPGDS